MAEILHPADLSEIENYVGAPDQNRSNWGRWDFLRNNSNFIARGTDSYVLAYKENRVIKVYPDGQRFTPQFQLYYEVTNKAANICREKPHYLNIENKDYLVVVNKIDKIFFSMKNDALYAISTKIPGKNMETEPYHYKESIRTELHSLSLKLNMETGVWGINPMLLNMKMAPPTAHTPTIIITDLCGSIYGLRRE